MKIAMTVVTRRLTLGLLPALVLAGCAHQPPQSMKHMDEVDETTTKDVADRASAESKKMFETMDRLSEKIEKRSKEEKLEAVEPTYDPLEAETISLSLSDASISDALRALAEESSLNLIIDPEVTRLENRATLSMKDVSVREALDSILDVYDVHGYQSGSTLRVSMMEEKSFALDFLNNMVEMDSTSGGNVFGSGGSVGGEGGGSNALQGDLSLTTRSGSSENPYKAVANQVRAIAGEAMERQGEDEEDVRRREGSRDVIVSVDEVSSSLYVKARPAVIDAIDDYMSRVKQTVGRQVYIEAQLIDVRLSDGYKFGVDWTLLREHLGGVVSNAATSLSAPQMVLPNAGGQLPDAEIDMGSQNLISGDEGKGLGVAYRDNNFGAVIQALDAFGNVSVLSNPQIMARNGSPALLSVGETSRFVSSASSTQTAPGGGATTTTADVETDSVFSGVMVGVVPYVHEDGNIELLVRPMQTEVDEASLELVNVGGDSRVSLPQVNLKGLTTTMRLRDGEVALIGGLIDQSSSKDDEGVPGLSSVPGFGRLFGTRQSLTQTRELVIVLRARVI